MDRVILRHKRILLCLLLILLLTACQQQGAGNPHLLRADALMEHYPDSALITLEGIEEPLKMKKADRAFYALLLTQAHEKNEITHTDDSLIQIAVDYYEDGKDVYREAQSLYYLGCVYADMNNITLSIDALLKAETTLGGKYKNDRLTYLINSNLASQYSSQGFYDKALEVSQKAYVNSIKRNDSTDLFFPLDQIGSTFLLQNENDSAFFYYDQALEIAEIQSDSSWVAYFSSKISRAHFYQKNFNKAYQYITKAINYDTDERSLLVYYCDKGDLFNEMQEQDSARYYLIKSLKSDNINTQFLSTLTLFEIERNAGNYKKAVEYIEIHNILDDSIYAVKKQAEIAKLLNEHAIKIHVKKITFQEKKKTVYIISSCIIVLILLAFTFMIVDKHRKSHIIKLQKQLMRNRTEILKTNQQKENLKTVDNISEKDILRKICIKNIETSGELFKKTIIYKEIHLLDRLNNKEIHLSLKTRSDLRETIYETFPDALLSLIDLYSLNSEDALCCILYSLNLSNCTVAACMGVAEGAIKTRKSRLKNKIDEELYTCLFLNN